MNKNTYEIFLKDNESVTESNQIFMVQNEDNRHVQYVSLHNVKSDMEDAPQTTIYELPTECYVDADTSSQLMTVSDTFILPHGENNIYNGNYLLHSEPSTDNNQVVENVDNEIKETNSDDAKKHENNSNVDCNVTEIVLSKDQCQSLEEKGWVLLETNDKVFLLDTLWLHDITTNEKLIQTLKREIKSKENLEFDSGSVQAEDLSCRSQETESFQKPYGELEAIEFVIDGDNITSNVENIQFVVKDTEGKEVNQIKFGKDKVSLLPENNIVPIEFLKNEYVEDPPQNIKEDIIKLKTSFILKDIPEKIVLGKTKYGKNLIAKITKQKPDSSRVKIIEVQENKTLTDNKSKELLLTSQYPIHYHKNLNTKYACGRCAEVFQSEEELKDHQEVHMDADDDNEKTLTIENKHWNGIYYVMDNENHKIYTCLQCHATFTKSSNCQRHIKTHFNTHADAEETPETSQMEKTSTSRMYQCKICYCTFNQPSTLSKHILSKHIKNTQKLKQQ